MLSLQQFIIHQKYCVCKVGKQEHHNAATWTCPLKIPKLLSLRRAVSSLTFGKR